MVQKERNEELDILKGLGIMFVVLGHCGQGTGITVFPQYSFHMPLFIFCSGYFFKECEKGNLNCLLKYLKKMMVPLIIWGCIYYLLLSIINGNLLAQLQQLVFFKNLFNYAIITCIFGNYGNNMFMSACWFVGCLFFVKLYFQFLHTRIFGWTANKVIAQIFLLILYGAISLAGVSRSMYLYEEKGSIPNWEMVILRICFGVFFFYFGMFFRCYLQEWIKKHKWTVLVICYTLMSLLYYTGIVLDFWMDRMLFKTSFLPIVTSILGIIFFYIIAYVCSINKCNFVRNIGKNSMSILFHHLFIMYMINLLLYMVEIISKEEMQMLYYRYEVKFTWPIYCMAGIILPIWGTKITSRYKTIMIQYLKRKNIRRGK